MFGFTGVGIGMSVYLRDHFSQNAARINGQMLQMYGNARALRAGLEDNFQALTMVGGAAFGAGILAAKGMASMVKTGMEFGKIMDSVAAVSEANIQQMAEMKNKALDLGKSTVFSVREIGLAMEDLAKAGFTSTQVTQSIEAVADLASASSFGLIQSADILNNVMQIFGKGAADSQHVADLLTYAANKSNINLDDMFEGLKYFGDIATDLNIPLEDSLALIMKLGNAGIKGSMAGTSLGNMFRYLTKAVSPFATGNQKQGLDMLGLTAEDLVDGKGQLKTMVELVDILTEAGKKLDPLTNQAAFEAIFGVRGKRGVSPLTRMSEIGGSVESYSTALKSADVAGMADKVAEQKIDNLAGDLKKLSAAWEVLSVTFTEKLEPFLRGLTQFVTKIVNAVQWIAGSKLGGIIAGATVALTGWLIAWGGIRLVVGLFGSMFLSSTATFQTMGQTLRLTLNSVFGQLFGINQGLRGVAINQHGRPYVQRGQTITHNGKTYKAGQMLPRGYLGPNVSPKGLQTGTKMGRGIGGMFGNLFGMGTRGAAGATGGTMGGLMGMLRGGFGRVFGSLLGMVGGWWGIGIGLMTGLVLDFDGTINLLGDILSGLGKVVIDVINALNPFTQIENAMGWLEAEFAGQHKSSVMQSIEKKGIFNRDAYMSDLYGGGDTSDQSKYYNKSGGPGRKLVNNIYIDGKLQMQQVMDDETETELFNQMSE